MGYAPGAAEVSDVRGITTRALLQLVIDGDRV
jgi:hypothetical protein